MTTLCAGGQEGRRIELDERFPEQPSWLRPEMLASLAELNEQYIDLIAVQAMTSTPPHGHPLLRELRSLLIVLDPAARRRAASCAYSLVDAGFGDPQRWLWARGHHVRDSQRMPVEQYLAVPQAIALARLVLTYAWHLSHMPSNAKRMMLGMTDRTAEILRTYTLRQMTDLAEVHPHWLQPRWPTHSRMWRELLLGAMKGEGPQLEHARMRGVQLLAAEVRSSALV
jgi:hypothetical protein